jgi:hypothetical protein
LKFGRLRKIVTLRSRPSDNEALAIELALARGGEALEIDWVAEFKHLRRLRHDLGAEHYLREQLKQRLIPIDPVMEVIERRALTERIDEVLASLTYRERKTVIERTRGTILEEVSRDFGVCRERVRQIGDRALRKLQHPARAHRLRPWAESLFGLKALDYAR